jgi:hypothetical protein
MTVFPAFRERVLFIGTQFSNLYTAVDTPAKGRVGLCVVFVCLVFACKYELGHSRVSQPPSSGYASSGTLAFSLRRMPPRPATDDALTHTGSSAQTSTIYTYNDNFINDSLINLTKEQPKESLDLNLVIW